MTGLPAHTKLSASSSERWTKCPGSAALIGNDPGEESEFAIEGTNAHTLAATALREEREAWELIGERLPTDDGMSFSVTQDMADAVGVYLNYVRAMREGEGFVETRVDDTTFHPDFGGTADYYKIMGASLEVVDYKHGEGIAVEAEDNSQLKYYAYGVLRKHPDIVNVRMTIVQPRAHHEEGPIRSFARTADQLHRWAVEDLLPAMHATAAKDAPLQPGKWCRFCPAKLRCPKAMGDMDDLAQLTPAVIPQMNDAQLAEARAKANHVRMVLKAIDAEVYARLMAGGEVPGAILVPRKSDRVWKPDAEALAREKFGDLAFTKPELLSPAQAEKQLIGGKAFASEFAFKPDNGLTVADADGKKKGVKPPTLADTFAGFGKAKEPEETY